MSVSKKMAIPAGFHVIAPDPKLVERKIKDGFRFISFSIDIQNFKY